MTTELNINLAGDEVKDFIRAKIRPTVEGMISEMDIEAAIKDALSGKSDTSTYAALLGYRDDRSLLEKLVASAVHDAAQRYVKKHIRDRRDEIRGMLKSALDGKTGEFASRLVSAADDALRNAWRFDFDISVSAKEQEDY